MSIKHDFNKLHLKINEEKNELFGEAKDIVLSAV